MLILFKENKIILKNKRIKVILKKKTEFPRSGPRLLMLHMI